jgi:acetyl-CoA carboxylase biotin carboxyl carrier protein
VDAKDDDKIQQVVQEARALIQMLEKSSVRRVSLEAGSFKIEIERAFAKGAAVAMAVTAGGAEEAAPADARHKVVAPLVGTFYLAPKPGAKPFVEVGARVQRGQTIGIIDVMKTLNEVPSDAAGVVVEILVSDGQPVEFNQPLILIDTAG